jgi:hypothetical protein
LGYKGTEVQARKARVIKVKRRTVKKISLADLSEEELQAVKALEKELGRVCLVAVEPKEALYAVEAKLGPNSWVPVSRAFPELSGLASYYADREDAQAAKSSLKSLLAGRPELKRIKKPIRIRKI